MQPIISLDELDIIATVSRRYATAAEVAAVTAEIQGWHADEDEPYVVTADEVVAVLRMRGVLLR